MDLSKLRSRRNILALALAGVAARASTARAMQSTAGCDIGFTNGLLTIGGADCKLLSPAGMDGAQIGLPPQMVDARTTSAPTTTSGDNSLTTTSQGTSTTGTTTTSSPSTTSTTSPQAERQARLQKHRDKKRQKRGRKTDQKQTQKGRQQTRKKTRLNAQEEQDRLDAMAHCSDFPNQKLAIDYLAQHKDEWETLDPDRDNLPCEDLKAVTCNQLRKLEPDEGATDEEIEEAVQSWLKRNGLSVSNNPLGLPFEGNVLCPPEVTMTSNQSNTTTEAQFVNG